jgi:WD40 repeat protein
MGTLVGHSTKRLQSACAAATLLVGGCTASFSQSGAEGAQRPELFVRAGMLTGMTGGSLAFSPDGQWYVSGNGAEWQIWSVPLHMELKRWSPVSQNLISTLAVASDDATILSLGDTVMTEPDFQKGNYESKLTTRVTLVNSRTGRVEREMTINGAVTHLAADPAELSFATLDADNNTVRALSIADGKTLFTSTLAEKPGTEMASNEQLGVFFSPDGSLLAALAPGHMTVWQWKNGKKLLDLDARTFHNSDLTRKVAVNYKDKKISTAEDEQYFYLQGAQFARDGKQMAVCSKDELTFFDIDPRKGVFLRNPIIPARDGQVYSACGFAPGGRYFTEDFSIEGSGLTTSLVDRKSGERKTVEGWVSFYPVPNSDLTLLKAMNESALMLENGDPVGTTPGNPVLPFHPSFTGGNQRLFWRTGQEYPLAWDLNTGEFGPVKTNRVAGYALATSADGKRFTYEEPRISSLSGSIAVAETNTGKIVARFPRGPMFTVMTMYEPSLNGDGSVVAVLQANGKDEPKGKNDVIDLELAVFHVADQKKLFTSAITTREAQNLLTALSPDGTLLAVSLPAGVNVYSVADGRKVAEINPAVKNEFPIPVGFSPDGKWLAMACPGWPMLLESTGDWKQQKHLNYVQDTPFVFSPDSRRIAYGKAPGVVPGTFSTPTGGGLVVADIDSEKSLFLAPDADTGINSWPAFSMDGKLIAVNTDEGMKLLNAATGDLVATLYVFGNDSTYDWLVVTPDGLFDGSPPVWNQILWRFNNDTFSVAPVEVFFREFYYPGLLADILAGKHPIASTDIAHIDRRQPVITVEPAGTATPGQVLESRMIKLHLHISDAPPDAQHKARSGARDLRLFRNGALVKVWRGELELDSRGQTILEEELPIIAGENRFTAYAYSDSDIKSPDATLILTGADSLKRDGVAYILDIGINEYADKDYNLKYAAADAEEFASVFSLQQRNLQNYITGKITSLVNQDATKANLLGALDRLAGRSADSFSPQQQRLFGNLAPAQPEDAVFIYYAGHGHAVGQRFYLLPHDFVMPARSEDLAKPEAHAVSDLELGDVFEKISAGRTLFVIDACRSGQALEAEEKRRGPMNSKGLAQLAYEKGMYILTAAQSDQAALESAALGGGHGFLTYALVERGLKTSDAAIDGQVELRHWLDFAVQLVPQLELDLMQEAQKQGRGFANTANREKVIASEEERSIQHPRVFYRREPEALPFIVARP